MNKDLTMASQFLVNAYNRFRPQALNEVLQDPMKRRAMILEVSKKVPTTPVLQAYLAGRLMMTPILARKKYEAVKFEKTGKEHSIAFGKERLSAWSWGDGPLVVMMHGWGGYGTQFKDFVNPLVESGHSVVVFDAYGHGQSDGRVSSVVHLARSIEAVVRHFNSTPKSIVAHSMGTSAALLYHYLFQRSLESLVLISPPFVGPLGHSKSFAKKVKISETIRSHMQSQIEWSLDVPWHQLEIPFLVEALELDSPLLIHDVGDNIVPIHGSEQIQNLRPKAEIFKTEGAGHFRILRNAEVIGKAVEYLSLTF